MNKEKQEMWEHYHKLCEVKGVTPLLFEIAESDGSRPKEKMFDDWIDHYDKLLNNLKGEVGEDTTEEIDSGDRIDAIAMDVFYKYADDFSGNHIAMDYDGFKRALREVLNKKMSNMEAPGKEYKNRLRRFGYTNHEIIDMVQNKEETDKLSELVFDEDESEALYRIMGNLSRGQVETCQVYDNVKPNMVKVYQKVLDWGHKNDVDIHGEMVKNSDSITNVVEMTKKEILDKYGYMITKEQWNSVMAQIQEEE